jgi:hypothetical protein
MKALFVIFSLPAGFFFGALVAGLTLPKQTGMQGGAVIFIYAIIGAIIGITLSLIFMNKFKPALLKKITIIIILFNVLFIIWIILRVLSDLPGQERPQNSPQQKTEPIIEPIMLLLPQNNGQTEMGLGLAKTNFYHRRV